MIIETKSTVALFMLFGEMVEVEPWEGKDIFYLIFPVFFGVQLGYATFKLKEKQFCSLDRLQ